MTAAGKQSPMISAAKLVLSFPNLGELVFSELAGITSKVIAQEYLSNDESDVIRSKGFGKTEPPTIRLRRGFDAAGNAKLMAWHGLARNGSPTARADGTLTIFDAQGEAQIVYMLHNAWCAELVISGITAGVSVAATIECKIICESILVG